MSLTNNTLDRLEKKLGSFFGRDFCCVTGRGATAIFLALRALPISSGKVVLPAVVCPSLPNAVLYAGFDPIFCDINLDNYTMDIGSLEKIIGQYTNVVAVIPVHLYGHPADMEKIEAITKPRGIFVIEDAAQAMGGVYKDKMLGSFADMSIISFGHTKILDCGWGGAVLTDNEELMKCIKEGLEQIPECPSYIDDLYNEYRRVYYTIQPLTRLNERLNDLFLPIPFIYREMYLFKLPVDKASPILEKMDSLDDSMVRRRENAKEYQNRLVHPDIIHPQIDEGYVPWRYTFLLKKDNQMYITEKMRADGIDVSNWYPSLFQWYASGKVQNINLFDNSRYFEKHVMNLWVEPTINREYIEKVCESLLNHLDEYA